MSCSGEVVDNETHSLSGVEIVSLYGKNKSDDGKLINWMKYVRQFLQQRKWDTEGKEKSKYMTAFIDSYYNLTKFTFPQLFGTSESTTAKIKEEESDPDFFSAVKMCKKRRIGPNREEGNRSLYYKKDISILARAGFNYELSKKVLEIPKEEFKKFCKMI